MQQAVTINFAIKCRLHSVLNDFSKDQTDNVVCKLSPSIDDLADNCQMELTLLISNILTIGAWTNQSDILAVSQLGCREIDSSRLIMLEYTMPDLLHYLRKQPVLHKWRICTYQRKLSRWWLLRSCYAKMNGFWRKHWKEPLWNDSQVEVEELGHNCMNYLYPWWI